MPAALRLVCGCDCRLQAVIVAHRLLDCDSNRDAHRDGSDRIRTAGGNDQLFFFVFFRAYARSPVVQREGARAILSGGRQQQRHWAGLDTLAVSGMGAT